MFFALEQCVNFSQVLKSYRSGGMNCHFFASCLFVMLVKPSRIPFFIKCSSRESTGGKGWEPWL